VTIAVAVVAKKVRAAAAKSCEAAEKKEKGDKEHFCSTPYL